MLPTHLLLLRFQLNEKHLFRVRLLCGQDSDHTIRYDKIEIFFVHRPDVKVLFDIRRPHDSRIGINSIEVIGELPELFTMSRFKC